MSEESKPHVVKSHDIGLDSDYVSWVHDVKQRYVSAQIKSAVKVNTEQLFFNWQLGRDLVERKAEEKWGKGMTGIKTFGNNETAETIIRMQNVNLVYPTGTAALKDCSLEIGKGEFVFIVGSSGSGKSTLIKTLLGELEISSGRIEVAGKDLANMTRKELPYFRRKLGVVFQEFRLLDEMNVFENVALAQRVVGVSSRERRRKNSLAMLEMVGLSKKLKAYPNELSGGEQQRVAIARAMVNRPAILLADEPTGNLDPENSWEIMKLLQDVHELGTTVLVVSHNEDIVNKMQKRVITLHKGQITSDARQGGYLQ